MRFADSSPPADADVAGAAAPAAAERPGDRGRRRLGTRLVGFAISAVLLLLLYRSLDLRSVGAAIAQARLGWLLAGLLMIALLTLLRALRFSWLVPTGAIQGLGEALRLTLVASAFNVFLPSKAGDLSKSFFIVRHGGADTGVAVAVVVYERLSDLFGLLLWCLAGRAFLGAGATVVPGTAWVVLVSLWAIVTALVLSETVSAAGGAALARWLPQPRFRKLHDLARGWEVLLRALRGRRVRLTLFAVGLWLAQLTQIWFFAVALELDVPFATCVTLSSLALMAGQLPFTFLGLGARDLALVALFSGIASPEKAAALGILTASRVLVPPLAALPILPRYLASVAAAGRSWGRS